MNCNCVFRHNSATVIYYVIYIKIPAVSHVYVYCIINTKILQEGTSLNACQ